MQSCTDDHMELVLCDFYAMTLTRITPLTTIALAKECCLHSHLSRELQDRDCLLLDTHRHCVAVSSCFARRHRVDLSPCFARRHLVAFRSCFED